MTKNHYKKFIEHLTEAKKMRLFAVRDDATKKLVKPIVDDIVDSCINLYSVSPLLCGIIARKLRRMSIKLLREEKLLTNYRSLCNSELKG